jgi:hypothetical protein
VEPKGQHGRRSGVAQDTEALEQRPALTRRHAVPGAPVPRGEQQRNRVRAVVVSVERWSELERALDGDGTQGQGNRQS